MSHFHPMHDDIRWMYNMRSSESAALGIIRGLPRKIDGASSKRFSNIGLWVGDRMLDMHERVSI